VTLSTEQMATALEGMAFPARTWEIVAWAEYNGVGHPVMEALLELPDRQYIGTQEVCVALRAPVPAPAPICGHRRHPHDCPYQHWDRELDRRAS
jgi:hypothetical protein